MRINDLNKDMGQIIRDIREAHRTGTTTADAASPAAEAQRKLQEAMQFEGSSKEKQVRALCGQRGIPHDKLTREEFVGLMAALEKSDISDILKETRNLLGRQSPYQTHVKGKRKKKAEQRKTRSIRTKIQILRVLFSPIRTDSCP
jgi:hypothetical protein